MNNQTLVAAFLAASSLVGCGPETQGSQAITDSARVDQIIVGTTTREQVRATFGAPESVAQVGRNEFWFYRFQRDSMNAAMFVPVAQVVAGRMQTDYVNLSITFDQRGVVTNVQRRCSRGNVGVMIRTSLQTVEC